MKSLLVLLSLLTAACATHVPYSFNDGPPRASCKADTLFAQVNMPWAWTCTISGNLSPYTQTMIGVEVVTKDREEWPQRSLVGEGLKRVYPYKSMFDIEYYNDLVGNSRITDPRAEIIRPGDPTYPMDPIEGLDGSLDGSFWLRVSFYEVLHVDPATRQMQMRLLTTGRVRGKLQCFQCAV